jgi:hypothetical protein
MNREDSGVGPPTGSYAGAHRAPPRARKSVAVRTITVGGAALCIGFSAEMNAPDAEALSILLPMGNGSATQINIFEGNVIDPQVNPAGNTSHDTIIGNIMLGNTPQGSSDIVVPIGSSGAAGYGNVTQVKHPVVQHHQPAGEPILRQHQQQHDGQQCLSRERKRRAGQQYERPDRSRSG